ncbi:uncharacterized protein LOC110639750 isoform X2 [Hevea brasiliensis]|uniref:uncharacterized protein LOC110639750 isoform X2 n=1 Tax=Hevea brasiliensis TaxID=3981 RepID=UPI0025D9F918|nr:uncharacterized protein LOC110639750 isoform X2 [Hevea brasiliensis]
MRGEEASSNYSMPSTGSGKKAMRSRKMRRHLDNVVIIDVDSDGFDNVIIIDVPESLQQKFKGSTVLREGKRFPIQGIISIDDDESDYVDHPEFNVENEGGLNGDESPSKNSPASDSMKKSEDADAKDCRVVLEKRSAFKLSKCKTTYTKKSPSRNRYGLNSESESDSSESSSSDCEVMEGSSSDLREQWEKASLKRKSHIYHKGESGLEGQDSPCSSHSDIHLNVRVENRTKQNLEDPVCFSSKNVNFQEENLSNCNATGDGFVGGAFNPWMGCPFARSGQKVDKESFSWQWKPASGKDTHIKDDVTLRETCMEDCNSFRDESQNMNGYDSRFQNERKGPLGPPPWSIHKGGCEQCHDTRNCFQHGKQRTKGEHSFPSFQQKLNLNSDYERASVHDEDASLCKGQCLGEMCSVNHRKDLSMEKGGNFTPATPSFDTCPIVAQCNSVGSKEKDKLVSGTLSSIDGDNPFTNSSSDILISDGKNPLYALNRDVIPAVQRDIINDREKLKETDEYKRAEEQEWVARQRQLQIQAEEAMRLRKRRKAETLRILDMEKRQKQRVEEVRETQRKVHAAYKRALLKFHPDRASRTDIRQQVEAEEKFKLISRMKEKFLSTSCF